MVSKKTRQRNALRIARKALRLKKLPFSLVNGTYCKWDYSAPTKKFCGGCALTMFAALDGKLDYVLRSGSEEADRVLRATRSMFNLRGQDAIIGVFDNEYDEYAQYLDEEGDYVDGDPEFNAIASRKTPLGRFRALCRFIVKNKGALPYARPLAKA